MPRQRGESKQDYGTPRALLDAIVKVHGRAFDLDLAASAENAKAPRFYTEAIDSLKQPWDGHCMWLNPPFAHITPWARRCAETSAARTEARIFFLTPASVGARWFIEYVHKKALVLALTPRLTFDGLPPNPKTGLVDPYPKDCMLSIFGEPPAFEVWEWQ